MTFMEWSIVDVLAEADGFYVDTVKLAYRINASPENVRWHVKNIRKKMQSVGEYPIISANGHGYRLNI